MDLHIITVMCLFNADSSVTIRFKPCWNVISISIGLPKMSEYNILREYKRNLISYVCCHFVEHSMCNNVLKAIFARTYGVRYSFNLYVLLAELK
jgi:hypothetical protein